MTSLTRRKRTEQREQPRDLWALRNVSFEVQEGSVLGVIGRNGAGKSTLLKILSRITLPTAGRVALRGRLGALLEVGTGFHPELTGRENILLNGAILGMSRGEVRSKFDEIVSFAEVERFVDTPVKRYSSGMHVRLAFAVAAHLEPDVLIVDEVLAVGDASFQKKCLGKLEGAAKEGRTVLFVSHNMAAVRALCTRGIVLSRGEVIFDGTQAEAIEAYLTSLQSEVADMDSRQDRGGSGAIRVNSIALRSSGGMPREIVMSGEAVDICFGYTARTSLFKSIRVSLHIASLAGEQLVIHDNHVTGDLFEGGPPTGTIVCTLPKLPLQVGNYRIGYTIYDQEVLLDSLEDAMELTVVQGDFFGTGKMPSQGMFLTECSWRIEPSTR